MPGLGERVGSGCARGETITHISGDDEPLPVGVFVRVVGAAAGRAPQRSAAWEKAMIRQILIRSPRPVQMTGDHFRDNPMRRPSLLLAVLLLTFGCDDTQSPAAPAAPSDGPRFSTDVDVYLGNVEPDPVTVGEIATVTVRTTGQYAALIYGTVYVTPPGELIREEYIQIPSGETEETFGIRAYSAGEWNVRLRSVHEQPFSRPGLQVGSPSTLTFQAVE